MSAVAVEDVAARKSSMCRREEHIQCQTAKAHCTCSCHGARGQAPPAAAAPVRPSPPTEDKEAPVAEPTPALAVAKVACTAPGCTRTFGTEHARRIHFSRAHAAGNDRTPPSPKPAKPAAKAIAVPLDEPEPPAPSEGGNVVLVRHDGRVEVVELQTRVDADRVVALLAALGIGAALYVEAV